MALSEYIIPHRLEFLLFIVYVILLIYWLWSRRHFYGFSLKQPGFLGFPLLGCADKITKIEDFFDTMDVVFMSLQKYYASLWLGIQPIFVASEPEIVGQILKSPDCLEKSRLLYKPFSGAFDEGLISMPGLIWRQHRRLVNPMFRQKVLRSFFNVFNGELMSTISEFRRLAENKTETGALEILTKNSFKTVFTTTIGQDTNNYETIFNFTLSVLDTGLELIQKAIVLNGWNLWWLIYLRPNFSKMFSQFRKQTKTIIKQRLESRRPKSGRDQQSDATDIEKYTQNFIDEATQLIDNGQLALDDVSNHANHILAAGSLTSTFTIFGAIVMLAIHPEKQQRLYEEILKVFPKKASEISIDSLKSLSYLDMVVKETMRLMPAAPIVGRECGADTMLNDSITLPKGIQIFINIFHLHRNKDVWGDDANQFKPERFDSEILKDLHPFAFIPFGKSSRDCIGQQYANYFIRVMLIGLIRNFKFTTQSKMEDLKFIPKFHIGLRVIPNLRIEERPGNK